MVSAAFLLLQEISLSWVSSNICDSNTVRPIHASQCFNAFNNIRLKMELQEKSSYPE
jgi:hypothetical protein